MLTKSKQYISYSLLFIFSILLYAILLSQSQDNDMYFEIVSGRDLLNGNFSTATHLNNFPMLVQQWLYAVCLAIVDRLGHLGHVLFVLVQDLLLYIISALFIQYKTHDNVKSYIYPMFAILYCHEYMINIRPQIITMVLLLSELLLLELYKDKKQYRYLISILPILILAANLHQAIFLYHIFVIIPYLYDKEKKIDLNILFSIPIYMLMSLLTPYGIDGSVYIFKTFLSKSFDIIKIQEVMPVSITSYVGVKIALIMIYSLYCIIIHKNDYFMYFYTFSVYILSLISIRHVSILYIAVIFVICHLNTKIDLYKVNVITLLCIGLCVVFSHKEVETYEDDMLKVIDKNASIYNSAMDLGGWLEYNGCTNIKLDSRVETFSELISGQSNILEDYYMVSTGLEYGYSELASDIMILQVIDNYDYVIARRPQYVIRVCSLYDHWQLVYSSDKYVVYKQRAI